MVPRTAVAKLTGTTLRTYSSSVQTAAVQATLVADVNITDLRQNLPSYLERARRGERFRVTSRGAVIAEISGPKVPEGDAERIREQLRGSVLQYDAPTEPALTPEDWTINQ